MTEYDKVNPTLICACGRTFRKYGYNKEGVRKEYKECFTCYSENFKKTTKKYE